MSDDRDERNREIEIAREKNGEEKEGFQMKQGDMTIMGLVEAFRRKEKFEDLEER